MYEKLTRRDYQLLALCAVILIVGLTIGIRYFDRAFPEASIDFRFDRGSSRELALEHLRFVGLNPQNYRHAAAFRHDDDAKVFLERKLGLEEANRVMSRDVKIWYWRHRWFRPLEREEFRVDIAPTGEVVSFAHTIAEEAAGSESSDLTQILAERYLAAVGVPTSQLELVNVSERKLPNRTEQIFVWDAREIKPTGAPYRFIVTMRGTTVAAYERQLRVPDDWLRSYHELRSRNLAAGRVDQLLMFLIIVAAAIVFVRHLKRGDLQLRFALWSSLIAAVLVAGVSLNAYSSALASYDTMESFSSFLLSFMFGSVLEGIASGLMLMVMVGAGEALYRKHYPNLLAPPRLFRRSALASKRVFFGFVIGYALFAAFLAYQTVFYIVAERFGAWSPADIPYDDILNTSFPWVAVLFMGFYPAVSEEYMSRAFSIPFFETIFKHRFTAIVVAGFIWGFGHAMYPNQPFYIRGVEVGIVGVVAGLLMVRVGLLPLLVWHYTVDALYTSFLMLRSGNPYYVFSSAAATLLFAIPLLLSVIGYIRRGGFVPDEALENRAIETVPEPPPQDRVEQPLVLPPPPRRIRTAIVLAASAVALALVFFASRNPSHHDVENYKIGEKRAQVIAQQHLASLGYTKLPVRSVVVPVGGFRSWEEEGVEEGGQPSGYDQIAAEYVVENSSRPFETLLQIERDKVEAANYTVRFYTPQQKEEFLVEIDPRKATAIGFHRFVDEGAPGARLERQAAEKIGAALLARYGFSTTEFAVKEALSFEHPARRDWLLHYEEKTPLAGDAYRRLHVRIAGDRPTQFTKTIKIPERAARAASEQTLINTLLMLARLAGTLLLGGIIVAGAVTAARHDGLNWRWAARITAPLALLAMAAAGTRWRSFIASYETSWAWETYLVSSATSVTALLLLWIAGLWLALAIIKAALPEAPLLLTRDGRARFGRDGMLRALLGLAIILAIASMTSIAAHAAPRFFSTDAISPSPFTNMTLPLIAAVWSTIAQTLLAAAAALSLTALLRDADPAWRTRLALLIMLAVFLFALDPAARPHQLASSITLSLVAAVTFGFILFRVLAPNPFAILSFVFLVLAIRHGGELWQNNRLDLRVQAAIFTAAVLAAILWFAARREKEPSVS